MNKNEQKMKNEQKCSKIFKKEQKLRKNTQNCTKINENYEK